MTSAPRPARSKSDIAFIVSIVAWWIVTLGGLALMPWTEDFFVSLFVDALPALLLMIALWSMVPILAAIMVVRRFRTDDEAFVYYFKWHGVADRERGVLFGESDEIRKPIAQRSAKWTQAARRCFDRGEPLGGHFYLVRSSIRCS